MPGTWLTSFRPRAMRKASPRWHTICGADMRPQRRVLSGRTSRRRRRTSVLSSGRARVFMAPSPAEHPLAPRFAEGGQRALAARFGAGQDFLEPRIAAQRVEMAAAGEGVGQDVALL